MDRAHNITPAVMTEQELAKYLRVSLPTVNRWRKAGKGPKWFRPDPDGRLVRYRIQDVDAYMEAQVNISM
jgi:excisionase family DNA binding protein